MNLAGLPRVVRAGDALLFERRTEGPLGERWDLPRGAVPVRDGVEDDRAGLSVLQVERQDVPTPYSWLEIASLRRQWAAGAMTLSADAAAIVRRVDKEPLGLAPSFGFETIEVAPSVRMLSVETPTLPPATHTNVFVIGSRDAVLVEPAASEPEELSRITRWVEALREEGVFVQAILPTHHHHDHTAGAAALRQCLGVPIAAHVETDARLPSDMRASRFIAHDECLVLEGPEPIRLRAIHTPGHAAGHLCFFDETSQILLAGDMVAGVGTILVEPGDGNMAEYLESLRRLLTIDSAALVPAHGGVLRPPRIVLERYVEHRLEREQRILSALRQFERVVTIAELLPEAYADAPRSVFPLAALSTEAHLIKLAEEGLAQRTPEGWRALWNAE